MNIDIENLDGIIIAHLRAEALDASNAKEFKTKAAALIIPGTTLIFNLGSLQFVDSSGLGALLSCLRQLNASGGALKLCGLVKPVRALFELVRMHRVFEIFNTQEEAIRSYRKDVVTLVD
ncbi:Anti-sigma B factor antagonist RsbV [Acidisarcina polymorpha]|uniref:Anti-sigma factor antagonist n=1 Tax=Acidisarcina polymorpha TaxID=2211140 RepID=A0A2Z5FUH2_9BACT|nr:STAS domain-containing protein [Acidisarcina polymorpha]AXC10136.1 Anti-sigma B factor antagonist RsbV [Acidisarcina polymorpha]